MFLEAYRMDIYLVEFIKLNSSIAGCIITLRTCFVYKMKEVQLY